MTATADVPGRPHPFDPIESPPREPGKEAQVKERQNAENAAAQAVLDPTTLGAVLFSTVVGPQGRAALISGKSYRLGSVVRLDHEGKTIDFLLTEIRSDGIVLQRGEKRFEILLPEPSTLDRMEINVLQEP
ncbi:MAG TPA: hypothetical protein VJL29_08970 [Thermoguttaceae bacterium]|nr:hypothetical protein [Thermoguttaceae bacterium]